MSMVDEKTLRVKGLKQEFAFAHGVLEDIPQEDLVRETPVDGYGTIGQQFRHIINYGEILIQCCNQDIIDFTKRVREAALETNRDVIQSRLLSFQTSLDSLLSGDHDRMLTQIYVPLAGGNPTRDKTSLGASINFVNFHVNHHTPLIVTLATGFGANIRCRAGIAPDTAVSKGMS